MDPETGAQRRAAFIAGFKVYLVKLLDLALVTLAFYALWLHFYAPLQHFPASRTVSIAIALIFAAFYYLNSHVYNGYRINMSRISGLITGQLLGAVVADAALYLVTAMLMRRLPHILPMIIILAVQTAVIVLWCVVARRWYSARFPKKRAFIVWETRGQLDDLMRVYGMDAYFQVTGSSEAKTFVKGGLAELKGIEAVFLYGVHTKERNQILKYCMGHDVQVYVIPRIGDVLMRGAEEVPMFNLPMFFLERHNPSPQYVIVKRLFDIMISAVALILASPVMLIFAAAIRLTDGGKVFYSQERLTKDDRVFRILKFRSMYMDSESDGVARLSTGDKDDRVTPVGRLMRKYRIDEIPQLINVLKGDMSLVGPRPERPEIAALYEEELPEFALRLQVKAGLTGYAQVYGKYNTIPYDKLLMDLMYIARASASLDLRILIGTIKILLIPENSTEGIGEGCKTAADGNEHE